MLAYTMQDEPDRFVSKHWMGVPLPNDQYLVTIAGVALITMPAAKSNDWNREQVALKLSFKAALPEGKLLRIEQWVPYVSISAHKTSDGGVAVDEFGAQISAGPADDVTITAKVAARPKGADIMRLGYHLSLRGTLSAT